MTADERSFLERSLADLDAEHDAGDLTDSDYDELRARYSSKLAALGTRRSTVIAPRRSGLAVAAWAFVAVVAVGGGVLLAASVGQREAGDTITGGVDQVATAAPGAGLDPALEACVGQDGTEALECFETYVSGHDQDPQGYVQFGLFVIQSGIAAGGNDDLFAAGETFLGEALDLDPDNLEARLYLAVLYNRTDRQADADEQLAQIDRDALPADLRPLYNLAAGAATTTTTGTTAAP